MGWTGVTSVYVASLFFFFNDTATTEIYTLSLHDALPIAWSFNLVLYGAPFVGPRPQRLRSAPTRFGEPASAHPAKYSLRSPAVPDNRRTLHSTSAAPPRLPPPQAPPPHAPQQGARQWPAASAPR